MTSLPLTPMQAKGLTPRQAEVVALVALGFSDKTISRDLDMSERRVRVIIARVCAIADVDTTKDRRVQLTRWWVGLPPTSQAA